MFYQILKNKLRKKMKFKGSQDFIEMLQFTREFIEEGLLIDKNPPKDVPIFLEVLDELKEAAKSVTNHKDWDKFYCEYHEDIKIVIQFGEAMIAFRNFSLK